MKSIRISIYVPCHNVDKFIEQCLQFILKQVIIPSEILVINDASTDRTVEIVEKFPVRVIHLPGHPGLAAARNAAISAAGGDLIASLDADCIADPRWLENLAKNMEDEKVAGAGGMLIEKHRKSLADRWRAAHMRQNWGVTRIVNPPFLFGCNTLFRKSALLKAGLYDEKLRSNGEDVDISLRLKEKGYTLVYDPAAAVTHLKRDTIPSVLRADWRWGYVSSGDTAKYENVSRIIYHNFTNAKYRFLNDIAAKRYSLLPLDVMLFFAHNYYDIIHARSIDQLKPPGFSPRPRIDALTRFHTHLEELSKNRFLQNPSSISSRSRAGGRPPQKILFVVFGAMGDIFNALPVVKALRKKYPSAHITWLTLPRYREIAECACVDRVITRGTGRHGDGIPPELISGGEYDAVFFPQGSFNHEEWERSGLHMVDFMARKCGVTVASRAPEVEIDDKTKSSVDLFWKEHSLKGKKVVALACSALSCREWPIERFRELVKKILSIKDVVPLMIGGENDALLPGAIDCRNLPLKTGIEIIGRCALFIGCDSGPSWMASCTGTPMIVLMDTERQRSYNVGFAHVMPEKNITEIPIETTVEEMLALIRRAVE